MTEFHSRPNAAEIRRGIKDPVGGFYQYLQRLHGERVEARQKERRVPPCVGHAFQEWPGSPSPNVEDGNY